jgi:hypothetical protein
MVPPLRGDPPMSTQRDASKISLGISEKQGPQRLTVVVPQLIQTWGPQLCGTNLEPQGRYLNDALADLVLAPGRFCALYGAIWRQLHAFGLHVFG